MTRALKYALAALLVAASVAGTYGAASYVDPRVVPLFAWCMGGAFAMLMPVWREVVHG